MRLHEETAEALVEELLSRCSHAVLMLRRDEGEGLLHVHRLWKGDRHVCVGLAMEAVSLVSFDTLERQKAAQANGGNG